MRIVTNRRLVDFSAIHPDADAPLQAWRRLMQGHEFTHFAALRQLFGGVDKVGDLYVFDIGGNKYRLIAFLHIEHRICFIKAVLTHAQYDRGAWK